MYGNNLDMYGEYAPHICEYDPNSAICKEMELRSEELEGVLKGVRGLTSGRKRLSKSINFRAGTPQINARPNREMESRIEEVEEELEGAYIYGQCMVKNTIHGGYGPHICESNPKSAICREMESRIEEVEAELEGVRAAAAEREGSLSAQVLRGIYKTVKAHMRQSMHI